MDNLARIVAVNVQRGAGTPTITPCVKVLRGMDAPARQLGVPYSVSMSFTYTSGGVHVEPVPSVQPLARLTFVQPLDAYFIRARGAPVSIPSMPDPNTPVVCTATIQYTTPEGLNVDCGPADTTTFYPTIPA